MAINDNHPCPHCYPRCPHGYPMVPLPTDPWCNPNIWRYPTDTHVVYC